MASSARRKGLRRSPTKGAMIARVYRLGRFGPSIGVHPISIRVTAQVAAGCHTNSAQGACRAAADLASARAKTRRSARAASSKRWSTCQFRLIFSTLRIFVTPPPRRGTGSGKAVMCAPQYHLCNADAIGRSARSVVRRGRSATLHRGLSTAFRDARLSRTKTFANAPLRGGVRRRRA